MALLENVAWNPDKTAVVILDQTLLPAETTYLTLRSPEAMREAIARLRVRGAPAIGIFAAYAMAALARQLEASGNPELVGTLRQYADYLGSARPTAVNLRWALDRMGRVADAAAADGASMGETVDRLYREAASIRAEDSQMCLAIAEQGLTLVQDGDGILTHCNAGPLATSHYGTALGPVLLGAERGIQLKVYADETRPLLQGARLTTYELAQAGVDVTLICDNMAGIVMQKGWIQACFVGCDRIAANGDTANKIGTSVVAVLAKHYGVPFYVLGPTSTIDMDCLSGADIEIELRDPAEIREMYFKAPMAPPEVPCYNPAFDVTDHSLITAIVTEQGICRPPYAQSIAALFAR